MLVDSPFSTLLAQHITAENEVVCCRPSDCIWWFILHAEKNQMNTACLDTAATHGVWSRILPCVVHGLLLEGVPPYFLFITEGAESLFGICVNKQSLSMAWIFNFFSRSHLSGQSLHFRKWQACLSHMHAVCEYWVHVSTRKDRCDCLHQMSELSRCDSKKGKDKREDFLCFFVIESIFSWHSTCSLKRTSIVDALPWRREAQKAKLFVRKRNSEIPEIAFENVFHRNLFWPCVVIHNATDVNMSFGRHDTTTRISFHLLSFFEFLIRMKRSKGSLRFWSERIFCQEHQSVFFAFRVRACNSEQKWTSNRNAPWWWHHELQLTKGFSCGSLLHSTSMFQNNTQETGKAKCRSATMPSIEDLTYFARTHELYQKFHGRLVKNFWWIGAPWRDQTWWLSSMLWGKNQTITTLNTQELTTSSTF